MKSSHNLRIVFTVSLLLVALSITISLINFAVSLNSTERDLKTRSLPLSIDNIYSEIQSHIIEPNLVSSMMAHDTFVEDWLKNDENNTQKITKYLETIQQKYGMFVTFLVSQKTLNYYTQDGFLEKLNYDKPDNRWFFRFRDAKPQHEINLDFNNNLDNSLIMFINYKIFDNTNHLIGATGIGLKISYIDKMLKRFRQKYNFTVFFIDKNGDIVLSEQKEKSPVNIVNVPELFELKDKIMTENPKIAAYSHNGNEYLVNTKYVPELDLYLVVKANLDDFIKNVRRTFYFNLTISLLVTLIVTLVILLMIRNYNKKLEFLAKNDALTTLMNRRAFDDMLHKFYLLSKRNQEPLTLLFFDIDNFKNINDTLGHHTGDKVLKRIAELLKERLRQSDLIARWGGEEFIAGLIDTDITNGQKIAENLRVAFEQDTKLMQLAGSPVTASFGLVTIMEDESIESALIRVDKAMYRAKENGKNRVVAAEA